MAIERNPLTRVFLYGGLRLPDPGPAMKPVEVRDLMAASGRPELSSAEVRGPEVVGNEMQFTFHRAVGAKGLKKPEPLNPDMDLQNIEVPKWINARFKAFSLAQVNADASVNKIVSCARVRNGKPILAPASAIRWFF